MGDYPTISIVIPTYNRPEALRTCLSQVLQLDYPATHFEVIVVDDGSDVSLDSLIEPFQQSQVVLRLVRQANAGPAAARNQGAAMAQGDYLVFTDDDCAPDANWLQALARQVTTTRVPMNLVGGYTINALPENIYSTASQLLIDYLYSYYNANNNGASFFASNNFAVPRRLFQELGGFDTSFPLAAGEDREFCDRWLHQGYPMKFVSEMKIYHAHHLTLRRFWLQHFNYGRGAYCFHQVRAQRQQGKIQVEPLAFYYRLFTYPFYGYSGFKGIMLAGLMGLSQVANIAGFFWERWQNRTGMNQPTVEAS